MGYGTSSTAAGTIPRAAILRAMQQDEQFVYAAITGESALKVGISTNVAKRLSNIAFGRATRLLAFYPGDIVEERRLHHELVAQRIYGTREYYYPHPDVLPTINAMRERMGQSALNRRDLPRLASCTFHRRVMEAERHGSSVFA